METNKIRQIFLDYFADHGHTVLPSSSLIPANDPTLLFTNAGMNQFKEVFLGKEKRPYKRAATVQCCVRAGGKHNDLENVGYTTRHHTFFEMLGNFSFGDYFKREAIKYAWEFLTEVLHIAPEKLSVTVYKDDREAEDIWLKEIKIDKERLTRHGEKDNFWAMGDTGPCGPCTEIFYDQVEIWNLVFMQYNRDADGKMTPLPQPSVDTGMGLERIAVVMQGVNSNYEIDIFRNLIKSITDFANAKAEIYQKSKQVISDHIRSCSFLIADGVIPANEGRGYVLRRIIRRALRHVNKLNIYEPFFYRLVAPLVKEMGGAYPKLAQEEKLIARVLHQEEEQFAYTLQQGLKILEQEIINLSNNIIPGTVVFRLYDTYGFPPDLTQDIAKERGLKIDQVGFDQAMTKQRQSSKQAERFTVDYSKALQVERATEFVGYEQESGQSKVIALFKDGEKVKIFKAKEQGIIILDKTPFYAEAGGQVGDRGEIKSGSNYFVVNDTQKQGAVYLHYGELKSGKLAVGDVVKAEVWAGKAAIAANHSATHLLHSALQQVLGSHVEQKGSAVDAERLRFDFSHFEQISEQQLYQVEAIVNQHIRANLPVTTQVMDIEEAKKEGATALFAEKYADKVRVVSIGAFSKELCGGNHVKATGEIGLFKIISEAAIAAGIRRIEAITGPKALEYVEDIETKVKNATLLLKTKSDLLLQKIEQVLAQNSIREKELIEFRNKLAELESAALLAKAVTIQGVNVIAAELHNVDNKTLRTTIDHLRQELDPAVVFLAAAIDSKIQLVAGVSKDYTNRIHAGELVSFVARELDGKGGGRADMAQGGGINIVKLPQVLATVAEWVDAKLREKV